MQSLCGISVRSCRIVTRMWMFLSTVHCHVIGQSMRLFTEIWMMSSTLDESKLDDWYSSRKNCLTVVDCVTPYSGYLFTSWKIFIGFHQTDPAGYTPVTPGRRIQGISFYSSGSAVRNFWDSGQHTLHHVQRVQARLQRLNINKVQSQNK